MDQHGVARFLEGFGDELAEALCAAEKENIEDALKTAQHIASGGLTPAMLQTMETINQRGTRWRRPRIGPGSALISGGGQEPQIMNALAGRFQTRWTSTGPDRTHDGVRASVENNAPDSAFLREGVPWMVGEPVMSRIEDAIAPRVERRREAAVEALFRRRTG